MFVLLCLSVCFRSVGAGMCRCSGPLRFAAGLKKKIQTYLLTFLSEKIFVEIWGRDTKTFLKIFV